MPVGVVAAKTPRPSRPWLAPMTALVCFAVVVGKASWTRTAGSNIFDVVKVGAESATVSMSWHSWLVYIVYQTMIMILDILVLLQINWTPLVGFRMGVDELDGSEDGGRQEEASDDEVITSDEQQACVD